MPADPFLGRCEDAFLLSDIALAFCLAAWVTGMVISIASLLS
jgi:hypothetical protein